MSLLLGHTDNKLANFTTETIDDKKQANTACAVYRSHKGFRRNPRFSQNVRKNLLTPTAG